jgi:hypothetical protein
MGTLVRPVAPVEMVVVGFPTAEFNGSIAPALAQIIANGTVRLLDLVLVSKAADGEVTILEVSDADADGIGEISLLVEDIPGLLGDTDIATVTDELPPDTSAALLVWENTWAIPVVAAIRSNGGFLIAHERIGADELSIVLDAIDD